MLGKPSIVLFFDRHISAWHPMQFLDCKPNRVRRFTQKVFQQIPGLYQLKGDIMEKYYFISYVTKRLGREFFDCSVIEEHPFAWLKTSLFETNFKIVLVGWQEISKEEYDLYNKEDAVDHTDQIVAHQTSPLDLLNRDPSEDLKC